MSPQPRVIIGWGADGFSLQMQGNESSRVYINQEDDVVSELSAWLNRYLNCYVEEIE
jgi:hypothetical protein